jgi:hypothetical protein
MKAPQPPKLETRRRREFSAELQERARAWIPAWVVTDNEGDFGRALLEIAARFNSEVAERLDGAGEKMRRGFLDFLAVRREAARPSRMPVVFKLIDAARQAVLAEAPVRMQADAAGVTVVFETEKDVRVIPGLLDTVVGADADADAFYLPPPGLSDLSPLKQLPTQWQVKSFASAGATKIQLDPELGLVKGMLIRANGQEYRVVAVEKDLVTIEPPLASGLTPSVPLAKVSTFSPFSGARNWQNHVLYLGDTELLNIEAAARIEVVGAAALREGLTWEYWGKVAPADEVGWQQLKQINEPDNNAVVLEKKKGDVELVAVGGRNTRWLRAYTNNVKPDGDPISTDQFGILINGAGCKSDLPCAFTGTEAMPVAEGMANTTPLVLTDFFPLGKEPRQFDAFYLGSQEAFSKPKAKVQICFEMADSSFTALSALRSGPSSNLRLSGVAADGRLYQFAFDQAAGRLSLLANREPVRPPAPALGGAAVTDPPVDLDKKPVFRSPVWTRLNEINTAVTAGITVWVWHENATQNLSGWESLGNVTTPDLDPNAKIAGLVFLADAGAGRLFALRDKKLFVRDLDDANGTWQELTTVDDNGNGVLFTKIAPIGIEGTDLGAGHFSEGLVGISETGKLYGVTFSGSTATCEQLLEDLATDITPAAVRRTNKRLVAVAIGRKEDSPRKVRAFLSDQGDANFVEDDSTDEDLVWAEVLGESIDVNVNGGELTFGWTSKIHAESTGLTVWTPFTNAAPDALFNTVIPFRIGLADGAPTLLTQHVLVPTRAGRVLIASFDPSLRLPRTAPTKAVVITEAPGDILVLNDHVAYKIDDSGSPATRLEKINSVVETRDKRFHALSQATINDEFMVYKQSTPPLTGTVPDATKLDEMLIDVTDQKTAAGSLLLITADTTELYRVVDFDETTRIAELHRELDLGDPTQPVLYRLPDSKSSKIRPMLQLNATSGNWDAALLDITSLQFEDAQPKLQTGTAFEVDPITNHPIRVALDQFWTVQPPDLDNVDFLVDASVGTWTTQLGDTSTNPELSWEYWNGTGWWKLSLDREDTLNFKKSGLVGFHVPDDLRSSDWAGRTNFWIRARLIGGDYGKEKVTVQIETIKGVTHQTINRSLEGIRPPSVQKLTVSYAICNPVLPKFVLTEDSGTIRDQSDANRTKAAIVEAFVPLALTLGKLSANQAVASTRPEKCPPPECGCSGQETAPSYPELDASRPPTTTGGVTPATGRSLFIGLAATPSEAPVNVLLLVDERNHTAFAPMKVEALIANSFQPIVVDDTTRALGESGLLSMSFPVSPTPSELFGKTLTWLRLTPKPSENEEWIPTIRGAYLNAAWASATETLTRELLGSSDGAPNLTVRLARPPVLRDTLQLRIKEPLGEEEREALLRNAPKKVVSNLRDLPGDWVLWTQVPDPTDELPDARVYSLDEASGMIRFGDGTHGRIPPIGRDSIVAFSYSRTETGQSAETGPGNTVGPRTALNLVSPVETVEAVTSADQAAGGAPAELDQRVLRFGFARVRHRNRAVTARDLEDLALQSSPDIVQARAVVRRGYIKLVVVMRGENPQPTAAQVRELRRLLLDAAPASLSATGALRIEGPNVRRLQVELELRVETLDQAGALGEWVKSQLKRLFDTAVGGVDNDGWPLGVNPTEDDIAFALIDAPNLESIVGVALREIVDGAIQDWPQTLKETEIVMLADDPVRLEFQTAEVFA